MVQYILKKLMSSFFVLMGVIVVVFVLFFVLLPADPARLTVGQRSDAKTLEHIRKELYLDQPRGKQFLLYLNDLSPLGYHALKDREKYRFLPLMKGKDNALVLKFPYLRRSYQTKKDVSSMLWEAFPGTFLLAGLSILLASIIGISLGIVAAVKHHTWLDTTSVAASVIGISAPSFFAGMVIAYLFGFLWHDITGLSIISPLYDIDPYTGKHLVLKSLVLPVLTLAIRPMAIITQITRSSMLDVLHQDYIRTAKAKGMTQQKIILKHALRNALNPVMTSISGWFAELLAGSFFIEYIFGWKGIGKVTVDALNKFDFPVVMGSVLFTAILFILVNALMDIIYRIVDPRIAMS